ncbi:hypothetical protein [Streptomyces sp. NPDC002205]|uniref:hypothetical protein n=1 Tax=Streptomyces sp. NPDC002205 TaxID=3154411 RepID=UPI00331BEC37
MVADAGAAPQERGVPVVNSAPGGYAFHSEPVGALVEHRPRAFPDVGFGVVQSAVTAAFLDAQQVEVVLSEHGDLLLGGVAAASWMF